MDMGMLCNRTVVIADPGDTVRDAAQRMREHHVGCLVVVERKHAVTEPIAVVTDRDLVMSSLANDEVRPSERTLSEFMSRDLLVAREQDDVYHVIQRMRARGVRRVPVVDEHGELQGIFTLDDMLELIAEQLAGLSGVVQREQKRERELRR